MAQKYRTVVVDGKPTRVKYNPTRVPASERNQGLLPSRYEQPDTMYTRKRKHRYSEEDS